MAGQADQNFVPTTRSLAIRNMRTRISNSPIETPDFYNWDRAPGLGFGPLDHRGFFTGWTHIKMNTLQGQPGSSVATHNQKKVDALMAFGNPSLTVMGTGGTLPNLAPLLQVGMTREDWLSLYRSLPRLLYTYGEEENHAEAGPQLGRLENQLLDTNQYDYDSSFLTVLVFGEGDYGQASLFQVERSDEAHRVHPFEGGYDGLATHIKPLAFAPAVPRKLLEQMGTAVQNRILLHKKNHHTELKETGAGLPELYINIVQFGTGRHYWSVGQGWKRALGIPFTRTETEGFRATLPQILGLLHLRGSGHERLRSSPAVWFRDDTHRQPVPVNGVQANRVIQFENDSRVMIGNQGTDFHVAVLFPKDVKWPLESFFWG